MQDLFGFYSDFFKEVHGFRPRGVLMPETEAEVEERIVQLEADLAAGTYEPEYITEVGGNWKAIDPEWSASEDRWAAFTADAT